MKHVKRKFLTEFQLAEGVLEKLAGNTKLIEGNNLQNMPVGDGKGILLLTEDNECVKAFEYKKDGKQYIIPEPHPVVIYFNSAQSDLRDLKERLPELLKALNYSDSQIMTSDISHKFYSFFSSSSGFAIFLFTAVEAAMNHLIPRKAEFKRPQKRKIEVYTYHHIQQMSFEEKLKEVIPYLTKKKFLMDMPSQYQSIVNLKAFRDEIAHTKAFVGGKTAYSHLFITALDFDYETTLLAVRDFINYYRPQLIEECDCDQDF